MTTSILNFDEKEIVSDIFNYFSNYIEKNKDKATCYIENFLIKIMKILFLLDLQKILIIKNLHFLN